MSDSFDPTPRPALRKAPDSDVHPTTHVAPAHIAPMNTSDAVLEGKSVDMTIRIPRKLRKHVRQAAKAGDVSVDQFVTLALAAEVQRRTK